MAIGVRNRFEVFKRDEFTCQYCGRKSPEVVLEVDHIVPSCEGGSDDVINLRTSCWDCNRGKGGVPLGEVVTGEDPHDRAVLLLEKERQLREYNAVLEFRAVRIDEEREELERYWVENTRWADVMPQDKTWLESALEKYPKARIKRAMDIAIRNRKTHDMAYVNAVLKNQRERGEI